MKNKHIKKLIKLYQKLNDQIEELHRLHIERGSTGQSHLESRTRLWELRKELEPKFNKLKKKLLSNDVLSSTIEESSQILDSLTGLDQDDTIEMSEIRDLLKDERVSSKEDDKIKELNKQIDQLRLKLSEHRTLTNYPVVASDNPDLWYSDPKHQHNLGGGYAAWAQMKDQQKTVSQDAIRRHIYGDRTNFSFRDLIKEPI